MPEHLPTVSDFLAAAGLLEPSETSVAKARVVRKPRRSAARKGRSRLAREAAPVTVGGARTTRGSAQAVQSR